MTSLAFVPIIHMILGGGIPVAVHRTDIEPYGATVAGLSPGSRRIIGGVSEVDNLFQV